VGSLRKQNEHLSVALQRKEHLEQLNSVVPNQAKSKTVKTERAKDLVPTSTKTDNQKTSQKLTQKQPIIQTTMFPKVCRFLTAIHQKNEGR
jgi:hypothetical protein